MICSPVLYYLDTQLIHTQNTKTAKEMWDNLALVHKAKGHYVLVLQAIALHGNMSLYAT
jgi:hypothetical protein